MDCIFCKIIKGEIPSYTLYEDDLVKVFMDIDPNTNGHCLIIPKKHIVTVMEVDSELASHIVEVEKKMYELLKEKLGALGLTIAQNNDLGQEVKHYHVHLIPRYEDDNWEMAYNQDSLTSTEETYHKIVD